MCPFALPQSTVARDIDISAHTLSVLLWPSGCPLCIHVLEIIARQKCGDDIIAQQKRLEIADIGLDFKEDLSEQPGRRKKKANSLKLPDNIDNDSDPDKSGDESDLLVSVSTNPPLSAYLSEGTAGATSLTKEAAEGLTLTKVRKEVKEKFETLRLHALKARLELPS